MIGRTLIQHTYAKASKVVYFVRPSYFGFESKWENFIDILVQYISSLYLDECDDMADYLNDNVISFSDYRTVNKEVIIFSEEEVNLAVDDLIKSNKHNNKTNKLEILVDFLFAKGAMFGKYVDLIIVGGNEIKKADNPYRWLKFFNIWFADTKEEIFEIIEKSKADISYHKAILNTNSNFDITNNFKSLIIKGLFNDADCAPTARARIISYFDYMLFISKLVEFYYIEKKDLPFDVEQANNSFLDTNSYLMKILDENDYIYESYINYSREITDDIRSLLNKTKKWLPYEFDGDSFRIEGLIYYAKEIRNIVAHITITNELAVLLNYLIMYCSILLSEALQIYDFRCEIHADTITMNYPGETELIVDRDSRYFHLHNNYLCMLWDVRNNKNIFINFFDGEHYTPSFEEVKK